MRRMLLICASLCLASTIPACASVGGSPPGSPASAADSTVLDERIALGVEAAYGGARTVAEVLVDTGQLKGAKAARVAKLDREAYAAVKLMRAAYSAGNSSSYLAAARTATGAVQAFLSSTRGEPH